MANEISDAVLSLGFIRQAHLLLTSRCNLRCEYCGISGIHTDPKEHQHMADDHVDKVIRLLSDGGATSVTLSGGEVTARKDWREIVTKIQNAGMAVTAIMNFQQILDQDDIEIISRFSSVVVSIDTPDRRKLNKIRIGAKLENMVLNLVALRSHSLRNGGQGPKVQINATIGEETFGDLEDLVSFTAACGIDNLTLTPVTKTDGIDMNFHSLNEGRRYSKNEIRAKLLAAEALSQRLGVQLVVEPELIELASDPGAAPNAAEVTRPRDGETRLCLDPWSLLLFKPNGDVHTCCIDYPAVAHIDEIETVADIFGGERNRLCKTEILEGNLHKSCEACVRRKIGPADQFRQVLEGLAQKAGQNRPVPQASDVAENA